MESFHVSTNLITNRGEGEDRAAMSGGVCFDDGSIFEGNSPSEFSVLVDVN